MVKKIQETIGEIHRRLEDESHEHHERLARLDRNAAEATRGRMLEIEERVSARRQRIEELNDEKNELIRSPLPKAELLALARVSLAEHRAEVLDILVAHLKKCQDGGERSHPFDPISLRLYEFPEDKAYRLFYLALGDTDLKEAVSRLPDVGVDRATREAKVKEINAEIDRLTSEADKDFI